MQTTSASGVSPESPSAIARLAQATTSAGSRSRRAAACPTVDAQLADGRQQSSASDQIEDLALTPVARPSRPLYSSTFSTEENRLSLPLSSILAQAARHVHWLPDVRVGGSASGTASVSGTSNVGRGRRAVRFAGSAANGSGSGRNRAGRERSSGGRRHGAPEGHG